MPMCVSSNLDRLPADPGVIARFIPTPLITLHFLQ